MNKPSLHQRAGFSMIELLVLLALLGFLLALLIPAVQKVRAAAGRAQAQNNLKQIGLACHSFNDTYRRLPPAFAKFANMPQATSIHVYLLPYIEQDNVYRQYVQGQPADNEIIRVYCSPLDPGLPEAPKGIQDNAANLRVFSDKGVRTQFDAPMPALGKEENGNARIPATFQDGTSNTIIFLTRYAVCGEGGSRYAAAPNTNVAAFAGQNPAKKSARPADVAGTFLLHPTAAQCVPTPLMGHSFTDAGIEVGLADGSVRTVRANVSAHTWNCAMHPSDGNALGSDWE